MLRTARDVHKVTTSAELLEKTAESVDALNARSRSLKQPEVASTRTTRSKPRKGPLVEWGTWRVACTNCGNWPAYDPVLEMAACLECGTVYTNLSVNGVVTDVEAALLSEPMTSKRNWNLE